MKSGNVDKKLFYIFVFLVPVFLGISLPVLAQQADTTQTKKKLELNKKAIPQPYHSERSANGFLVPESQRYDVPEPKAYYMPPFQGQESLDRAVAAYRKELKNSIANTPFFQFLSIIAPYITNQFEFGVYRINDLPIVDRDNPYFQSYHSNQKKQ